MIRYYLLETTDTHLINLVQVFLKDTVEIYPNFNRWYTETVVPNIQKTRKIIVACDGRILCGVAIVKTEIPKKVCTLYVAHRYRKQGIGTRLLKLSTDTLRTFNPHITVSSRVLDQYLPLLEKHKFRLYKTYKDYYKVGDTEYSFNGSI